MQVDWSPLRHALYGYRRDGLSLPIWWRDDDAIAPTPALDRLLQVSTNVELPVHLAVIPDHAETALARHISGVQAFVPIVHGWRHENHAPHNAKKSEFGVFRATGRSELAWALETMRALFGAKVLAFFVPPWNRLDAAYLPTLNELGYKGFSTYGARLSARSAASLVQINTHFDPIDWRGTRGLIEHDVLIAGIVKLLEERRIRATDPEEPLGFLTHHLVHDERLWTFAERLLQELLEGGAVAQPIAPLLE
ncbi:MAG: polysaccharide deacetylase family protein, partial [Pseudomonadota bacterium]